MNKKRRHFYIEELDSCCYCPLWEDCQKTNQLYTTDPTIEMVDIPVSEECPLTSVAANASYTISKGSNDDLEGLLKMFFEIKRPN